MSRTDHEKRDDYRDMIDLPHPLTGYEEAIEETALRQRSEIMARDRMKD